jgi:N-acetylmuramoyl-L-alanine amidase
MFWLARRLKELKVDVAIELHFNAAGPLATGYEFLHWFCSPKGVALGHKMLREFTKAFPEQRNRGLKSIDAADRGGLFLRKTHCPSLICEPFFGSNKKDTAFFFARREELAVVYADGVINWLAEQ